jgi:nitronate monooxygenase
MKANFLVDKVGLEVPVICGAMYPCSNPELVAAASASGGIGIVQPLSLVYVWGHDFREGLKKIRSLTKRPFGMNVLLEKTSRVYEERMRKWIDIALEEGCRFFVTALGNPKETAERVHAAGGFVFHDVTERKWALKAKEGGVDGLICVNNRAGGHAGSRDPEALYRELSDLGLPLVCAGGVGDEVAFGKMLRLGYSGVQMGTRFIATAECLSHADYKEAILGAEEKDIVHTERVTGIPLAVIRTPYVDKVGLKAGPFAKFLLRHRKTKEWMRLYYNLHALWSMKRSVHRGFSTKDYWQAGKSVAGIEKIEPVEAVLKRFRRVFEGIRASDAP